MQEESILVDAKFCKRGQEKSEATSENKNLEDLKIRSQAPYSQNYRNSTTVVRFRCKTRAVTIASLHASAHTGDSGYALKPWMLVPFMNPSTPAEEEFNRRHCRTRVTIEQLFGIVKSRFRCIHKTGGCLCYVPAKCCRIIAAVFILHNICVDNKILCLENENVPDEYNDLNPPLNEGVVCDNGQQIRRNLTAQFV
ncbi:HARBI1 [Mytilus edulis]|uniref:HARBI1 n=1 Tax=Mytilus edulis TaxID=6550 RepID=A0A8S3SHS7_MYTED|nr:HARBI1 [Mytilus edulis]